LEIEKMPELPEPIQSLLNPEAYPDKTQGIELVQTQISYVFLAGEHVYKIKKPVDFGFLDYSTLEKRLHFCRKEVELNQRLCPNAYLGVIPVTAANSNYKIGGEGTAIEYAVHMKRLPGEVMMDVLLGQNKVTMEMIDKVAKIIADFHSKAATGGEINEIGGIDAVIKNTTENFEQTERFVGTVIPAETFQRIKSFNNKFIDSNTALFRKRLGDSRIRDCHGDLHAAHICFCDNICIYDCIEFLDRFRYCDVASEVAFLAMDLHRYGHPDLSERFVDAYIENSGDTELRKMLNFYKCYRAYVRCKVGCQQYEDPYIPATEKDKILATTRGYFELAESYIEG
jgi:aminoglycoside phosphotransferase family enzyme